MSKRFSLVVFSSVPFLALVACHENSLVGIGAGDSKASRAASEAPEARELRITKPPDIRPWDTSTTALSEEITLREGVAHIAFKETGAQRSLGTGVRAAVYHGTIDAGLALLRLRAVSILGVYRDIALVRVEIDGATAAALSLHPLVDFIEPAQPRSVIGTAWHAPTTSMLATTDSVPWGIDTLNIRNAWAPNWLRGAGARVLIIDTGYNRGHFDLPVLPDPNCAGPGGGCDDAYPWHGTSVTGVIASTWNGGGSVGAAFDIANGVFEFGYCSVPTSPQCTSDTSIQGINWGTALQIQVINMSYAGPFDLAESTAIANAWANNIVLVAGLGNSGANLVSYPAGYDHVIGVAGIGPNGSFAFSNPCGIGTGSDYGSAVDFVAPFSTFTTEGGNVNATSCGNSLAAPFVSGIAALMRGYDPSMGCAASLRSTRCDSEG